MEHHACVCCSVSNRLGFRMSSSPTRMPTAHVSGREQEHEVQPDPRDRRWLRGEGSRPVIIGNHSHVFFDPLAARRLLVFRCSNF